MKNLVTIFLISLLLLTGCVTCAEAKSKSFTIKVSCIVPARLEMAAPTDFTYEEEHIEYQKNEPASSKIQTQETKIIDGKETIVYTIVER